MYEIFTLIHSEKRKIMFAFLLKYSIRIHPWLSFNLKSTGDVQVITIPLIFSFDNIQYDPTMIKL